MNAIEAFCDKILETADSDQTNPKKYIGPPVDPDTGQIIPVNPNKKEIDQGILYTDAQVHDPTSDEEENTNLSLMNPDAVNIEKQQRAEIDSTVEKAVRDKKKKKKKKKHGQDNDEDTSDDDSVDEAIHIQDTGKQYLWDFDVTPDELGKPESYVSGSYINSIGWKPMENNVLDLVNNLLEDCIDLDEAGKVTKQYQVTRFDPKTGKGVPVETPKAKEIAKNLAEPDEERKLPPDLGGATGHYLAMQGVAKRQINASKNIDKLSPYLYEIMTGYQKKKSQLSEGLYSQSRAGIKQAQSIIHGSATDSVALNPENQVPHDVSLEPEKPAVVFGQHGAEVQTGLPALDLSAITPHPEANVETPSPVETGVSGETKISPLTSVKPKKVIAPKAKPEKESIKLDTSRLHHGVMFKASEGIKKSAIDKVGQWNASVGSALLRYIDPSNISGGIGKCTGFDANGRQCDQPGTTFHIADETDTGPANMALTPDVYRTGANKGKPYTKLALVSRDGKPLGRPEKHIKHVLCDDCAKQALADPDKDHMEIDLNQFATNKVERKVHPTREQKAQKKAETQAEVDAKLKAEAEHNEKNVPIGQNTNPTKRHNTYSSGVLQSRPMSRSQLLKHGPPAPDVIPVSPGHLKLLDLMRRRSGSVSTSRGLGDVITKMEQHPGVALARKGRRV